MPGPALRERLRASCSSQCRVALTAERLPRDARPIDLSTVAVLVIGAATDVCQAIHRDELPENLAVATWHRRRGSRKLRSGLNDVGAQPVICPSTPQSKGRKLSTAQEANTMNATMNRVEEILDGIEPEFADVPAGEIPDYLPGLDSSDDNGTC
jgi:hypothetical protein